MEHGENRYNIKMNVSKDSRSCLTSPENAGVWGGLERMADDIAGRLKIGGYSSDSFDSADPSKFLLSDSSESAFFSSDSSSSDETSIFSYGDATIEFATPGRKGAHFTKSMMSSVSGSAYTMHPNESDANLTFEKAEKKRRSVIPKFLRSPKRGRKTRNPNHVRSPVTNEIESLEEISKPSAPSVDENRKHQSTELSSCGSDEQSNEDDKSSTSECLSPLSTNNEQERRIRSVTTRELSEPVIPLKESPRKAVLPSATFDTAAVHKLADATSCSDEENEIVFGAASTNRESQGLFNDASIWNSVDQSKFRDTMGRIHTTSSVSQNSPQGMSPRINLVQRSPRKWEKRYTTLCSRIEADQEELQRVRQSPNQTTRPAGIAEHLKRIQEKKAQTSKTQQSLIVRPDSIDDGSEVSTTAPENKLPAEVETRGIVSPTFETPRPSSSFPSSRDLTTPANSERNPVQQFDSSSKLASQAAITVTMPETDGEIEIERTSPKSHSRRQHTEAPKPARKQESKRGALFRKAKMFSKSSSRRAPSKVNPPANELPTLPEEPSSFCSSSQETKHRDSPPGSIQTKSFSLVDTDELLIMDFSKDNTDVCVSTASSSQMKANENQSVSSRPSSDADDSDTYKDDGLGTMCLPIDAEALYESNIEVQVNTNHSLDGSISVDETESGLSISEKSHTSSWRRKMGRKISKLTTKVTKNDANDRPGSSRSIGNKGSSGKRSFGIRRSQRGIQRPSSVKSLTVSELSSPHFSVGQSNVFSPADSALSGASQMTSDTITWENSTGKKRHSSLSSIKRPRSMFGRSKEMKKALRRNGSDDEDRIDIPADFRSIPEKLPRQSNDGMENDSVDLMKLTAADSNVGATIVARASGSSRNFDQSGNYHTEAQNPSKRTVVKLGDYECKLPQSRTDILNGSGSNTIDLDGVTVSLLKENDIDSIPTVLSPLGSTRSVDCIRLTETKDEKLANVERKLSARLAADLKILSSIQKRRRQRREFKANEMKEVEELIEDEPNGLDLETDSTWIGTFRRMFSCQ